MILRRLTLTGFRNYASQSVEFFPGVNVICGSNAQGKTNLLEGAYLLTGSHSFRTRYDRELISFGREWATLEAVLAAEGREQQIRLSLRRGGRRQVSVNGAGRTSQALGELIQAVLFSPEDLYLIREGAAARRRLLDRAISQLRPRYADTLRDYNRLFANKTRILRDWREKPALLETLDEFSQGLAGCSARIIRYRASFVRALRREAAAIHRDFSGGREELDIQYRTVSTVTDPLTGEREILSQVLAHQEAHRRAELDAGQCLTGAHKDDLEIFIDGSAARSFASQGQARTAALSIKLAEREIFRQDTGSYPLLLLDDVLSELDLSRQEYVLNRIGGGQTLITCCEDEQISSRTGGRLLVVEEGKILRSEPASLGF